MSTKDLARTAIEGGRRRFNTFERRYSHHAARARERDLLRQLVLEEHELDELTFVPLHKVHREFHDKLGPIERWLAAQADRPFRKVHQELFERFDVRTLAERHVVFDHLLPGRFVREDGRWTVHRRMEFWIDRHGILRARRRNRRAEQKPWRDARAFADFRKVWRIDAGYVWVSHTWSPSTWTRTEVIGDPLTRDELRGLFALSPEALALVLID